MTCNQRNSTWWSPKRLAWPITLEWSTLFELMKEKKVNNPVPLVTVNLRAPFAFLFSIDFFIRPICRLPTLWSRFLYEFDLDTMCWMRAWAFCWWPNSSATIYTRVERWNSNGLDGSKFEIFGSWYFAYVCIQNHEKQSKVFDERIVFDDKDDKRACSLLSETNVESSVRSLSRYFSMFNIKVAFDFKVGGLKRGRMANGRCCYCKSRHRKCCGWRGWIRTWIVVAFLKLSENWNRVGRLSLAIKPDTS